MYEKLSLSLLIFISNFMRKGIKMGTSVFHWQTGFSRDFNERVFRIVEKKCKPEQLMQSRRAFSCQTSSAVGCVAQGSVPEMHGQISVGKALSHTRAELTPRMQSQEDENIQGKRGRVNLCQGAKPPDMYSVMDPGSKWRCTAKLAARGCVGIFTQSVRMALHPVFP